MNYIKIEKIESEIVISNSNGFAKKWGPKTTHKGSNIYELATKLLGKKTSMVVEVQENQLTYDVAQPDLFLLAQLQLK